MTARLMACILSTVAIFCDFSGNPVFNSSASVQLPYITSLSQNSLVTFEVNTVELKRNSSLVLVVGDTFVAGSAVIKLFSAVPAQGLLIKLIESRAFYTGNFSSFTVVKDYGEQNCQTIRSTLIYDRGVMLSVSLIESACGLNSGQIAVVVISSLAGAVFFCLLVFFIVRFGRILRVRKDEAVVPLEKTDPTSSINGSNDFSYLFWDSNVSNLSHQTKFCLQCGCATPDIRLQHPVQYQRTNFPQARISKKKRA